ncbi:hypothetical protein Patl1_22316 [Pistacia atlantica]|uniref:Uncharacterized protein n=1 Tax=Pistacia atlantica TaxID=434234 RepID=A0ACC1A013_9ROSI|nr:hypothetical protein Patl1_22316 [Pistacia atlantica]
MLSLRKALVFLILQFLEDEKFEESLHKLEKESGFYFNVKYLYEKVQAGDWVEVEKYLSGFTKIDDNQDSIKIFYEIRKQKYLEALDRRDKAKALEMLDNELKVFSTLNEEGYKELTQLLTLSNFRENEQLSKYDTKTARSILLIELKKLMEANPRFRNKLTFPTLKDSGLQSLMNGLNWLHLFGKNPWAKKNPRPEKNPGLNPDIKTEFTDDTCTPPNGPPVAADAKPASSNSEMLRLQRAFLFLILQFLEEEKFEESLHKLEKESGFYFNVRYLYEKVQAGDWVEVEKYLSGFTKVDDNQESMKIFYEIRKQKYLEALDRREKAKALEILETDLKVFSTLNEEGYKEITQLLTLSNLRENEQLSKYDTETARFILLIELKKLIEANPCFLNKLTFPTRKDSELQSLMNGLNWLHLFGKNPWPEKNPRLNPDIKTEFTNQTCTPPNGPPAVADAKPASCNPKMGIWLSPEHINENVKALKKARDRELEEQKLLLKNLEYLHGIIKLDHMNGQDFASMQLDELRAILEKLVRHGSSNVRDKALYISRKLDANQGAGQADHTHWNGAEFAQHPLSLPSGPITRLRAKRFKETKWANPRELD